MKYETQPSTPESTSNKNRHGLHELKRSVAVGLSTLMAAGIASPAEAATKVSKQKVDTPQETYTISTSTVKKMPKKGVIMVTAEGKVVGYDDKDDSETLTSSATASKTMTIRYKGFSSKEVLKKYKSSVAKLESQASRNAVAEARYQDQLQDKEIGENEAKTEMASLSAEQIAAIREAINNDTGTKMEDTDALWNQGTVNVDNDKLTAVYIRDLDLKKDTYTAGKNIRWTTIEKGENIATETAQLLADAKAAVAAANEASSKQ
jgi:hypothetical protein